MRRRGSRPPGCGNRRQEVVAVTVSPTVYPKGTRLALRERRPWRLTRTFEAGRYFARRP